MSLRRVLIALDQLGNTLIGGHEDETISARAWRNRDQPVWGAARRVIDALFFWQSGHCHNSYARERERKGLAPEYRI